MGRTMNIMRGNNKNAGVDAVNRIRIFGECAARGSKAVAYATKERQVWSGLFFSPGFLFDMAVCEDYQ